MALSNEDKKDVAGAFGKKVAGAVSKATHDGSKGSGWKVPKDVKSWEKKRDSDSMAMRLAEGKKKDMAKKIGSVKEAASYSKERAEHTKKTGWEESGTGSRFIPKAFR